MRFPPGSELIAGYYVRGGFSPTVLAVVRSPGPPEAVAPGGAQISSATLEGAGFAEPMFPDPSSLGLQDTCLGAVVVTHDGGATNLCWLWLFEDEQSGGTVAYMSWCLE
jgi:hypothetical protein